MTGSQPHISEPHIPALIDISLRKLLVEVGRISITTISPIPGQPLITWLAYSRW
jgi:hypothetical protein